MYSYSFKFLLHLISHSLSKRKRNQRELVCTAQTYLQEAGRVGFHSASFFSVFVSLSCPVARQIWPNEVAGTLTFCPAERRLVHWE